jgi:hypothetical protein
MTVNRGCWDEVKRLLGYLRPWVDTKSYRPLIALVVVSLGVFLAPLALDVAYAVFLGVPLWLRNAIGQGLFLTLGGFGLRRLWQVRSTD